MTKTTTFGLLVLTACLALTQARPGVGSHADARSLASTQPGTPSGWWFTLKTKSGHCILRHWPPRGSDTCNVYCIGRSYDHWWLWRLVKASGAGPLFSGDLVQLQTWNMPYSRSCGVDRSSAVVCGVGTATNFVIEKTSGSGAINLVADDFYLKLGNLYCGLKGRGQSQKLICNVAPKDKASAATIFQFPASSFSAATLTSKLSNGTCGGNYARDWDANDGVSCNVNTTASSYTSFVLGLKAPGSPVVTAGAEVAIKQYNFLFSYQNAQWNSIGAKVELAEEAIYAPTQWFRLERVFGASVGGTLANVTEVAIRGSNGNYCGITSEIQKALLCDAPGPVSSLPSGYRYTYTISTDY